MMTRWKAFSIHIIISITIAACVSVPLLLLWYTPDLFLAADGHRLLMLLLGIDVVMGPLITLIIYNNTKSRRELTFDFSIIGILQIAALIYGMGITFQARPVFIAFTQDSFTVATANQIADVHLARSTHPQFKTLPLTGPIYVFTEMPTDTLGINELQFFKAASMGVECFPQYFKPYSENMKIAGQAARPVSELKKLKHDQASDINKAIEKSGRPESDVGYLPLKGMYAGLTILLGKSDGQILGILQFSPI